MGPNRPFGHRDDSEIAILEALVNRQHDGLTVLELRSHTDVDIDELERALQALQHDGLIQVTQNGGRTVIYPDESVIPDRAEGDERSILDALLDRLPFRNDD